jgi:hypothetical protein
MSKFYHFGHVILIVFAAILVYFTSLLLYIAKDPKFKSQSRAHLSCYNTSNFQRPYYTLLLILVFTNSFVPLFLELLLFLSTFNPYSTFNVGEPLKTDFLNKGYIFLTLINLLPLIYNGSLA